MNRVRAGLFAVVVGLAGLSVGMKELLAGTPCAPQRYGPLSPVLVCGGDCANSAACQDKPSQLPGRVTMHHCMCGGAQASFAPCEFMVFVATDGRVVPGCVEIKCGRCSSPTFDTNRKAWSCKCLK